MAQACIRTIFLVAGGFFCGLASALSAAELSPQAEVPVAVIPAANAGRVPCASPGVCGLRVSQALPSETSANIVSDQIRRQGYACDEPRQAERDREASRPNLTVWILTCGNATYRVTLIPDMAARVERLK
jgi:hypothetical protein